MFLKLLHILLLVHGLGGLLVAKLKSIGLIGTDTLYDYVEVYAPSAHLDKLYPKSLYGVPTVNGVPEDTLAGKKPYLISGVQVAWALYYLLFCGNGRRSNG